MRTVLIALLYCLSFAASLSAAAETKPNILWIYVEDLSPLIGCYGNTVAKTPHLDALAEQGVRFEHAFMPAPVCSATRSAIITGTMQTTFGLHNHRSSRLEFRRQTIQNPDRIELPAGVSTLPQLFKSAGYRTFNQGKDDYNFIYDRKQLYDAGTTSMKFDAQVIRDLITSETPRPFFGQIQLRGGKSLPIVRGAAPYLPPKAVKNPVDRSAVEIPPYYPDHPVIREEWAVHHDCVEITDAEVGQIMDVLKQAQLLDNTIVFFFTDHGARMLRHKQFLYEGGLHVPLIVTGPGLERDKTRSDLVSGIDIAVTSLALAGIPLPKYVEGRNIFATDYQPREFIIAARDRCDYTIEKMRAVRTPRYKYIRNYQTDRPYMQPQYRDSWLQTKVLKQLYATGKLDPVQARFFSDVKPAEELYDLEVDPHEIRNRVRDPELSKVLEQHRAILQNWIHETGDQGQKPESQAGLAAVLQRWGKQCVNPEYEPVRKKTAAAKN